MAEKVSGLVSLALAVAAFRRYAKPFSTKPEAFWTEHVDNSPSSCLPLRPSQLRDHVVWPVQVE
jgi:hypothetical protein